MNTFDYWFNYIVKNGIFINTCQECCWKIFVVAKNVKYEYIAFYHPEYNDVMKKSIGTFCSNWQPPYDTHGRLFAEENFDINNFSLKPLIKIRRIV